MNKSLLLAFALAAAAFFALVAPNSGAATEPGVAVSRIRLPLPSGAIQAELFESNETKMHPAVLILHGAGGTLLDGPEMRRLARSLAREGNAVYLLHYFDRSGTVVALDSTMQRNFSVWLETVREAIAQVQQSRGDGSRLGVYGYSLGAFLALAAASENPRVRAVVEQAGGAWNGKVEKLRRLPPVLMVHGKRDLRVPFERYAQPLVPLLERRARLVETRFFPEEGHGFRPGAMMEVRTMTAAFFRRQLGTSRPTSTERSSSSHESRGRVRGTE